MMEKFKRFRILVTIVVAVAIFASGLLTGFLIAKKASGNGNDEVVKDTHEKDDNPEDGRTVNEILGEWTMEAYLLYIRCFPSDTPTPTPSPTSTPTPTATPTPSASPTPTNTPTPTPSPTPVYANSLGPVISNDVDSNINTIKTDSTAQNAAVDAIEDVLGVDHRVWSQFISTEQCSEGFMYSVEYEITVGDLDRSTMTIPVTIDISRRDYRNAFGGVIRYYFSQMGYNTTATEDIWGSLNLGLFALYDVIDYLANNISADSFMDIYFEQSNQAQVFENTFVINYQVRLNNDDTLDSVSAPPGAYDPIRAFLWEG